MSRSLRAACAVAIVCLALSAPLGAADGGELLGFIEDSHGAPLAGAVVSLFGRSLGGGGLILLSDASGRVFLPSLPAGSYTLRALRDGHVPARARRITMVPGRDAVFTVSLQPLGDPGEERALDRTEAKTADTAVDREWRWLTRHKRRSVLETEGQEAEATTEESARLASADAPRLPDVGGSLEVLATPSAVGINPEMLGFETSPVSFSVLRLDGRLASTGRWSLGGLVSESEGTTWRMAAEFVIAPGGGHEIQAGTGYGTSFLRPLAANAADRSQNRSVGAVFVQDRWQMSEALAVTGGSRFSYTAYLDDRVHVDPMVSVEYARNRTRFSGTASARTLTPGGDLLALSTIATAPALAVAAMEEALSAEKVVRYEVAVDRAFGSTTVRAYTFQENVDNPLSNTFSPGRALQIGNTAPVACRGLGLTVGRRFGEAFQGSVTYSGGSGWSRAGEPDPRPAPFNQADFHDLVARLDAQLAWSDTRLVAFYRLNTLRRDDEIDAATNTRFDVQLSQGLPFLGGLTRADWDLLVGFRNLYYEPDEGAVLDEVTVADPPKTVLGGISVRF